jgi:hypothetical protein
MLRDGRPTNTGSIPGKNKRLLDPVIEISSLKRNQQSVCLPFYNMRKETDPVSETLCSFLLSNQTEPEVYTASYPVGAYGWFREVRRPECENDHSSQSTAEVRNV